MAAHARRIEHRDGLDYVDTLDVLERLAGRLVSVRVSAVPEGEDGFPLLEARGTLGKRQSGTEGEAFVHVFSVENGPRDEPGLPGPRDGSLVLRASDFTSATVAADGDRSIATILLCGASRSAPLRCMKLIVATE